jgi:hypothetical protein
MTVCETLTKTRLRHDCHDFEESGRISAKTAPAALIEKGSLIGAKRRAGRWKRKKIDPAGGRIMARKSDQDGCLGKRWSSRELFRGRSRSQRERVVLTTDTEQKNRIPISRGSKSKFERNIVSMESGSEL